jgi:serine protease Do
MWHRVSRRIVILSLAFLVVGLTECEARPAPGREAAAQAAVASQQTSAGQSVVDLRTAIQVIAKDTIPAVVHIEVTQRQEVTNPFLPFENDPFFRYFFNVPRMPRKFKRELKGLGTGMIIDAQGHILTDYHVVGGASEIKVLLADGSEYTGKVVGTDPKTDLAVIKISADKPLPHVTFGDSDKVEVGEWVVAIGHPRGLDETVTQGIISAKHRTGIMDPSSYQDYLQTDAAINPGNSGGPLLDLEGKVIGINAAIASQSGGFEGIGFAIPSNMALHIATALITHGKVERGWLGVTIQDLTPELAKKFSLVNPKGALIADVLKGSPADKGGLKRGDVILSYRGKSVPDSGVLRNEVANTPVGDDAELTVWREGKQQELTIKVGSLEEAAKMLLGSVKERLGATVRPVTQKEADAYGLDTDEGVAIGSVDPKGPLGQAGFEVDDIILEINDTPVEGVDGLVNLVNGLPHNQKAVIKALDHRSGETGEVEVTVR